MCGGSKCYIHTILAKRSACLTLELKRMPSVQLSHFSMAGAVYIEDCEGWWLSSCRSSVVERWFHKPGVLGFIPGDYRPFHIRIFTS